MEILLNLKYIPPFFAFGNNNPNISSEYINIIAAIGNDINVLININCFAFLLTSSIFPFAIDLEILGTRAVTNATFKENGRLSKLSIFPLKIPYCIFASSSVVICFKNLTIVNESIFLLNDDIKDIYNYKY